MPGGPKDSPSRQGPDDRSKGLLLDWLDAIAKLVGAAAVLAVALIANSFQSRLTGVSIQSQREQAESQLRANMFTSLITPISGPQKDGKPISAERESLLAELLALNFHENFELKPLLEDASDRLVPKVDPDQPSLSHAPDPREPLWSIARRISERQKASIAWEWAVDKSSNEGSWLGRYRRWWRQSGRQRCEFYTLTVDSKLPVSAEIIKAPACQVAGAFGDTVWFKSPDENYTLQMTMVDPDWKNQTVKVSVWPFSSRQPRPVETDTAYNFRLSWFDFPFTDNTLLPDGNRFAIYPRFISSQDGKDGKLTAVVMWFPKGYFTPRERPLNYREVQALMGRGSQ